MDYELYFHISGTVLFISVAVYYLIYFFNSKFRKTVYNKQIYNPSSLANTIGWICMASLFFMMFFSILGDLPVKWGTIKEPLSTLEKVFVLAVLVTMFLAALALQIRLFFIKKTPWGKYIKWMVVFWILASLIRLISR